MKRDIGPDDCVLTGLSTLESDPQRAARTRQCCRAALERRARPTESFASEAHATHAPRHAATALRKAFACAVCILWLVYVVALIATTVGLQGTMP
jgi:hypothetical protein